MIVATSVTGNGAETAPRMAGHLAGSVAGAGMRGGAVLGRNSTATDSTLRTGPAPGGGAATGAGAMPSFGALMMQQGAMAGERVEAPVAGSAEEIADAGEAKAGPAAEEGGDGSPDGDGRPAFCPLARDAASAAGAMGAMGATGAAGGEETRGGVTAPGSMDGSGSGLRAGVIAAQSMEKTAVAQRAAMNASSIRTQTAGPAVVNKPSKAATPVNGKSGMQGGPSAVPGAHGTVTGNGTGSGAGVDAVSSASPVQVPAAHEREAAPAAQGNGAVGKVSGASAAAPHSAVPSAGKDLQSAGGQDATGAKDLSGPGEPGDAGVKGGESALPSRAATAASSTVLAAHQPADAVHGAMPGGTAVSPAGVGVNAAETGLLAAGGTSAGAALPHGVQGTVAASSSAGPVHATAGGMFARMDAAAAPLVTESSPQRLAVGVRDAGLGWVEIRAHAAGGQVSAVLTAASSEAQATLSAHLPEVREYLAAQQVRVDQLSSQPMMEGQGGGSGRGPNENAGNAQAGNGQAGNPEAQERGSAAALYAGDAESLSYINVRV